MKTLTISVVMVLAIVQAVWADEDLLKGVWVGNDRASDAIYGKMRITAQEISWGRTNPYNPFCETTYKLISKYTAATYPDNTFPLKAGRTFMIYKVKLEPQPCAKGLRYLQFALPSDKGRYAEVVTYGAGGRKDGWHNFSKVVDDREANKK